MCPCAGLSAPIACPKEFYQSHEGATSCMSCPNATQGSSVCNATQPTPLPPSSNNCTAFWCNFTLTTWVLFSGSVAFVGFCSFAVWRAWKRHNDSKTNQPFDLQTPLLSPTGSSYGAPPFESHVVVDSDRAPEPVLCPSMQSCSDFCFYVCILNSSQRMNSKPSILVSIVSL
jgi:hypothetical protein